MRKNHKFSMCFTKTLTENIDSIWTGGYEFYFCLVHLLFWLVYVFYAQDNWLIFYVIRLVSTFLTPKSHCHIQQKKHVNKLV